MRQTVVGVFDRYADARRAASLLQERGIPPDSVFLTEAADEAADVTEERDSATRREGGVLASVRNFFADLFGDDTHDDIKAYSEAVRRGGAVVKVEVDDDPTLDAAREALQTAGAVDIDERMSSWQQGTDTTSAPTSTETPGSTARTGEVKQEEVIPVVREDIEVGKRTVQAGGVRVYSRTVSEPVRESVDLREERAVVERRAVDRPLSAEDASALKERTVEVTESVERPVVQKTARVVEEVVVGKEVRQVQADVKDTVRHTEVEVQSLRAGDLPADDLAAYRRDFETRYASTGGRFEDYEPAYRYGRTARGDTRYAKREWNDVETDLERDWTTRYPDSPWERVKGAVRHAWDRMTV